MKHTLARTYVIIVLVSTAISFAIGVYIHQDIVPALIGAGVTFAYQAIVFSLIYLMYVYMFSDE